MIHGKLYLIPSFLGESAPDTVFPSRNIEAVSLIRDFIVEEERTARRFLKSLNKSIDISLLKFYLLNEHTHISEISEYLNAAIEGRDVGLLSEAGMPCVADPGSMIVSLAHQKGITVVPLTGPSSVFLALAASGFNGQNFCFHGYLPIDKSARIHKIKEIEQQIYLKDQTQIFIETPYRNMAILDALLSACRAGSLLCIAADVTLQTEFIKTRTIESWRKNKPELNKRPAVFLLYR
jgi:16S rRNA (cytidine1402-2'-O)-methyltransferase